MNTPPCTNSLYLQFGMVESKHMFTPSVRIGTMSFRYLLLYAWSTSFNFMCYIIPLVISTTQKHLYLPFTIVVMFKGISLSAHTCFDFFHLFYILSCIGALTQAIRNFAKSLEGWLSNAMNNIPQRMIQTKVN